VSGARTILPRMFCTIQTIEQLKAAHQGRKPSAEDIPPDVATPLVHAMLDKQYRTILDEPSECSASYRSAPQPAPKLAA
ncbi:hypothetical protein ACC853_38420, partial [Rhizobium johnstonii]